MPVWLLQSLASRLVWEILLIVGIGAGLAYLKRKWPEYASSVLYGLAGSAWTGGPAFCVP